AALVAAAAVPGAASRSVSGPLQARATMPEQPIERRADQPQLGVAEPPAASDHPSRSPSFSPPTPTHNLPAALTPLVGRAGELDQPAAWLTRPDCRLITLVGTGGVGKTGLALELARAHLASFSDGVYFVSLAPLASADALASAIVRALDLAVQAGDLTAA